MLNQYESLLFLEFNLKTYEAVEAMRWSYVTGSKPHFLLKAELHFLNLRAYIDSEIGPFYITEITVTTKGSYSNTLDMAYNAIINCHLF